MNTQQVVRLMAYVSMAQRMKAKDRGLALPDGSYPITNQHQLESAWRLRGNSKKYSKARVEAHIKKCAAKLHLKVPDKE